MTQEIQTDSVHPTLDAVFVEVVADLVESGSREEAALRVAELYPDELALLMHRLPLAEAGILLRWLPREQASEVLPELDEDFRTELLETMRPARLTALLAELDSDDAADILGDLPEDVVQQILPRLEDAADLQELLSHDEDSAGGLMSTDYVAVPGDATVAEATEAVRAKAEDVDPIYAVYVVDEAERLIGVVSLKRLLLSKARTPIREIMEEDLVSVGPEMDQEEVAQLMERRDLVVLPVVDANQVLLGRITIDDVVDVIREEAEEDIQRMSGISADEELTASAFKISRGRVLWLFVGLVGASLSAVVINRFEHVLEQAVVLAMFIPVVTAMGGNAGTQSSAIAVQGLASGDLWSSDLFSRLGKELVVAVLNGLPLGLVCGGMVVLLQRFGLLRLALADALHLGATVGLSLVVVILLATTIGSTVPLVLDRFGIDPAIATGPFVTTSNDIIGLLVYFFFATTLYLR